MSYKICQACDGSTNWMTGVVTQPFDPTNEDPQITEFECPYCGYAETETIPAPATMGAYNTDLQRVYDPGELGVSWGIYNSGVGYKMEPVPDLLA